MREPYFLKRLDASDLRDVAVLEALCFSEPWSENALKLLTGDEAVGFAVCVENERQGRTVVAYGGMLIAPDDGQITSIAVHPEHRRQGLGRVVLDAMIAEAERLRLSQMSLEVRVSNLAAIGLYLSAGFVSAGVRKGFYRRPPEDAQVMLREMKTVKDG